ncbi:molybdenum cofactor guanylyltransferase [Alkalihalobacterium alkalinitrilicum]|uniref:molybdenum cofactor guanylyltransferase n=1 Tax=Alkalihalobacterium alkalinitrilicum TaxID=427920 RepID=UPI0009949A03|nr:molybdenum cofactor guanylyltransferase [Alkalihalobacterium alkalinitrilicum]
MNSYQIVGIVLAGGASRRFGEPKALYHIDGRPFFQYSIEALKNTVENITIVSQPELLESIKQQTTYEVIFDVEKFRGFGPLAGIYTCMKKVQSEWYVTLPCDTPFITEEIIIRLLSYTKKYPEQDAFIPKIAGKNQPLIAVYHRRCLPTVEKHLKEHQLKMGALFKVINTKFLDENEFNNFEAFRNINTKKDIAPD